MLNSIELRNWKTHKHTKLSFSRGTNILLGQMGAGKSTIMDAISFALFGTYPALQHRRTSVGSIIANRPERMKSASVKLGLEIDGESYEVERSLELNGSGKATLAKNGNYLQSQPQRVNEEIEKILKLDYDLFSRAIYSEQNRLTYFLELRPSERKKQIDELLGLDRFATAQENATALINKVKDMVAESEKTATNFDVEGLKEQHKALEKEIERIKNTKTEQEEKLKALEKERSNVAGDLKAKKALYDKKTALAKELEGLKSRVSVIAKEIGKYEKKTRERGVVEKELTETKSHLESSKKKVETAEDKSESSRKALASAEAEAKGHAKDSAERERLLGELGKSDKKSVEEEIAKWSKELKIRSNSLESNIANKKEGEKWLAELEKHIGKCPICERELSEELKKKIVEDRKKSIKELESQIEKQIKEVARAEEELEARKKKLNTITVTEEKLTAYKDVEKKLATAKAALEKVLFADGTAKEDLKAAQESVSKIREALKDVELEMQQIEKREELEKELAVSSKELDKKEQESKAISVSPSEVDALQARLTKTSSETSELKAKLEASVASERDKQAQAEEKMKEIETIAKIYEEISRKKVITDNLAKFKNALAETQVELRNALVGSINEIMHDIWPDLYPYGDYQSIRLDVESDDYMLKVKTSSPDGEAWEDVEAIASGGERSIACLAMRVALALVLAPNLKWLILDEPTHNIDQNGLNKFVKAINDVLPRIIDQVFIITHDETLKQVVNARMYVFTRNKDESGETMTEAF